MAKFQAEPIDRMAGRHMGLYLIVLHSFLFNSTAIQTENLKKMLAVLLENGILFEHASEEFSCGVKSTLKDFLTRLEAQGARMPTEEETQRVFRSLFG